MSEYQLMKDYTDLGEKLGYEGQALRNFVTELYNSERTRRNEVFSQDKEKREQENKALELSLQIEKTKLATAQSGATSVQSFATPKPKLPKFDESVDDVDAFLDRFERFATSNKWSNSDWAVNLSPLLTGKALQAYVSLSVTDSNNYEVVKKTILNRYLLSEEGYRQKFRDTNPEKDETVIQFTSRMSLYFERWMELGSVTKDYKSLKDIILREQFLRKCRPDLRMFLKERTPKSFKESISLAEQYLDAHGGSIFGVVKSLRNRNDGFKDNVAISDLKGPEKVSDLGRSVRTCFLCNRSGHIAKDCVLKTKLQGIKDINSKPKYEGKSAACLQDEIFNKIEKCPDVYFNNGDNDVDDQDDDGLTRIKGYVGNTQVDVLLDSGCTGVIVREDLVLPEQMTGKFKRCLLADSTLRICPVAKIYIDTPFYVGQVEASCMKNPICDLLIGEKISGLPTSKPEPPKEYPGKTVPLVECKNDNFNPFHDMTLPDKEISAAMTRAQAKRKSLRPLKVIKPIESLETPITLADQESDLSLCKLFSANNSDKRIIKHEGLWYRKFDSHNDSINQLLIPLSHRARVLKLSHEALMGGHMGVKKTIDRVLNYFYWPGVISDVKKWCRSCDACQRTIAKGKVTKVPLGNMPLISTPFQTVAIDLVGPLSPISSQGNRYILTFMDYGTRWPEAVPLPDITTERIAEALLSIFSRLGFPKEIVSDRGSQFTSEIMKEVCRLISVKQCFTTPYHPMANGLNERFNGTLKSLLKKMCIERPNDWDRYLNALLFAYREVPQASTGFSPFELLYGRSVKGPLGLLKELWVNENCDNEVHNTFNYVTELREKLERTCQIAHENLGKSKIVQKTYYDKKARDRRYNVGDKVLLLLPTDSNKLLLSWKGPFDIIEVLNDCDYRIMLTNGKTKVFHVNLLRKYETRSDIFAISVISNLDPEEDELVQVPEVRGTESHLDVSINPDLSNCQKKEILSLVSEFKDIFSNKPGKTNLSEHVITLQEKGPIREKPYPLPYATRIAIENEVQTMLKDGMIEKSSSDYSAPIVLVGKPDGSYRFCVNYKKLNKATKFDNEPMNLPNDILSKLSGKKYFTKLDFARGFWQIPMEEKSKEYTSFTTPSGCYNFCVMPFGLVNSPATYNRMMRKLLNGMKDVDNYVDDVLGHSVTWGSHLLTLRQLFTEIRRAGLTIRPTKCLLGYTSISFLGHKVSLNEIAPEDNILNKILDASPPKTKKQLRSFLGLIGWYQKFVPHFSSVTACLTDLLQKGRPNNLKWEKDHEHSFVNLKRLITSFPILRSPDFSKVFIVQTDASDYGVGAALLQNVEGTLMPVEFASRKLQPRERRYSVIEKEGLAIIFALKKFDKYLFGKEFEICTDHSALQYIDKKKPDNSRLLRWSLFLQNYKYSISAIKGSDNILADYLSRL